MAVSVLDRAPIRAVPTTPGRRLLVALPELVPCFVAGYSLPGMVLLLAGRFYVLLALALGLVAGALATWAWWRGVERCAVVRRSDWAPVVALLVLVTGWTAWNVRHTGQDLKAERDPTTYLLAGQRLAYHHSLPIPTDAQVFGSLPGLNAQSAGFSSSGPTTLYAQGNHLLPTMLAVAVRAGGVPAVLGANAVIAGLGLIAVFAFARRVVPPWMALGVVAVLAASIPMIYVARDAFSEPLTLLLLTGGLALLAGAVRSGRVADHVLAGLAVGTSAMVRIDGQVAVLALVVAVAVLLATAGPGDRRAAAVRLGALCAAVALPSVLGFWDVAWLSNGYFHDEHHNIVTVVGACVLLAAVAAPVACATWWPPVRARLGGSALRRRLGVVASAGSALALAGGITRPWWQHPSQNLRNTFLEMVQQQSGLTVDGRRTYDEYTLHWQAMYLGWATVVLAFVGLAVLVRRVVVAGELGLAAVAAVGGGLSALYLYTSQITPDQPWAARRYVPLVLPTMLVCAALALRMLWARRARWARPAATVLGVLALGWPLVITWPVRSVSQEHGELAQVRDLCAALPPDAAVLGLDDFTRLNYGQTVRGICGVPFIALPGATASDIAAVSAAVAAGGRTLYTIAGEATFLPDGVRDSVPFSTASLTGWRPTLQAPPHGTSRQVVTIYLDRAAADGTLTPV